QGDVAGVAHGAGEDRWVERRVGRGWRGLAYDDGRTVRAGAGGEGGVGHGAAETFVVGRGREGVGIGAAGIKWDDVAAGEVGGLARGQGDGSEDGRVGHEPVVDDEDVGQGDVAGVADGAGED